MMIPVRHSDGHWSVPVVVDDPQTVELRLKQLDVPLDVLEAVLVTARAGFVECGKDHPRPYPGTVLQGEAVGELRRRQTLRGWHNRDKDNYALTVHPSGSLAIAVACGTPATGDRDQTPMTRSAKGRASTVAVHQNQMTLFDMQPEITPPDLQTWMLLVYVSPQTYDIRAELSLPLGFNDKGHIAGWAERIIISPPDGSVVVSRRPMSPGAPTSHSGEIKVRRKEG